MVDHLLATVLASLLGTAIALLATPAAGQDPVPVQEPEEDDLVHFPELPAPEPPAPWVPPSAEEWRARIERDRRTGFLPRSATEGLLDIEHAPTPSDRRAVALLAVGASGENLHRARLAAWAEVGTLVERTAAVLALGELGAAGNDRLSSTEKDALARLVDDPDTTLAGCALLALLRADAVRGRALASSLANEPGHRLAGAAADLLTFSLDAAGSRPSEGSARLLELRWEAAKAYGTVDGQAWADTLVRGLSVDEDFLERLVLFSAAELPHPAVEDHLLELILDDPTPTRLRAAVRRMPNKLDAMVGSGLWQLPSEEAWTVVVDEAVSADVAALMPKIFQSALSRPLLAATAAGELVAIDPRFRDPILASLRSEDREVRLRACEAAARGEVEEAIAVLSTLAEDPDPEVRITALVARHSLDDARATYAVQLILGDPQHQSHAALVDRLVRSYEWPHVLALIDQLRLRSEGAQRAVFVACMFLRGRATGLSELREAFLDVDPDSFGGRLVLRALGHYSTGRDLEFLAEKFPLEGHVEANLEIALALARGEHYTVRPLFQEAIWRVPKNRSVLAAGVVHARVGVRILALLIERPPPGATTEDIRRVGFAVGQWAGLAGLADLIQRFGNRTDDPALQGALMGALLSRTYP